MTHTEHVVENGLEAKCEPLNYGIDDDVMQDDVMQNVIAQTLIRVVTEFRVVYPCISTNNFIEKNLTAKRAQAF